MLTGHRHRLYLQDGLDTVLNLSWEQVSQRHEGTADVQDVREILLSLVSYLDDALHAMHPGPIGYCSSHLCMLNNWL